MKAPRSTYRVQLHEGFGFADALAIVDYLHALGVGALYTSPILEAQPGSTHGYDCVDPTRVSVALGGEEKLIALAEALHAKDMQLVVDFVPNHMGIASHCNVWWDDVLENGASSRWADFFDIDWTPGKRLLDHRVLLPILGDSYGATLEKGELRLSYENRAIRLHYFERSLPVAPRSLAPVISRISNDPECRSVARALASLPDKDETSEEARDERAAENAVCKRRLCDLCEQRPEIRKALEDELARLSGSADELDHLLSRQAYRLSHWRVAHESINYRRFFEINTLAALRMEEPKVFAAVHAKILDLCKRGHIDGLRLDHTDGLYDPKAYFAALRQATNVWIVAEKILEPGERLPESWAIDGTTGYDYAYAATGVLCDSAAEKPLDAFAREFTGEDLSLEERIVRSKRLVLTQALSSEVAMLTRLLERITEEDRRYRDITFGALQTAIIETIAHFPVYRAYVSLGEISEQDRTHIIKAIGRAARVNAGMSDLPFKLLGEVLTQYSPFTMRFQQLSGPAMAKAVEDTVFYAHNRFLAANEVGGDPAHIGVSVAAYHTQNMDRCAIWPRAMITTATHDTKRGEDARARLAVLSEMPELWADTVRRWSARETNISRNDEYHFYQTLVATLPFSFDEAQLEERLIAYMHKAAREAKENTSWINPHEAYEDALAEFVRGFVRSPALMEDARKFVQKLEPAAVTNALSQTLLKLCSPGVPDIFQGTELWDLSLVDPDNRRPVDFAQRRGLMKEPDPGLHHYENGAIKQWLIQRALYWRNRLPDLVSGGYKPIDGGKHIVAFARGRVVVAVTRLPWTLSRGMFPLGKTREKEAISLAGEYDDLLTGRTLKVGERISGAQLFERLPVALLARLKSSV